MDLASRGATGGVPREVAADLFRSNGTGSRGRIWNVRGPFCAPSHSAQASEYSWNWYVMGGQLIKDNCSLSVMSRYYFVEEIQINVR